MCGCTCPDVKKFKNLVIQPFLMEMNRNLVNAIHVLGSNNGIGGNIGEQGDFFLQACRSEAHFCPAQEDIRLNTMARNSVPLCCVGLVFTSPAVLIYGTRVK